MTSSDHSVHEASRRVDVDTRVGLEQRDVRWWGWLGLLIPPCVLSFAARFAPQFNVGEFWGDQLTYLGSVFTISTTLYVLSYTKSTRLWFGFILFALLSLLIVSLTDSPGVAAFVMIGTALMTIGHGIGGMIGSRIQHPGHLLPACVVAASFDIASVIHPQGPSHALVSSEHALPWLTLSFPVFGARAFSPNVGIGDVVFAALLLGAAARHGLSRPRFVALITAGLIIAGQLAALLQQAIPALPIIGICIVVGVAPARIMRRKERRVAFWFMAASVTLALGVIASRFLA